MSNLQKSVKSNNKNIYWALTMSVTVRNGLFHLILTTITLWIGHHCYPHFIKKRYKFIQLTAERRSKPQIILPVCFDYHPHFTHSVSFLWRIKRDVLCVINNINLTVHLNCCTLRLFTAQSMFSFPNMSPNTFFFPNTFNTNI